MDFIVSLIYFMWHTYNGKATWDVVSDRVELSEHLLSVIAAHLALPCLAFGVGRFLHLPSAEAVSVRPNARPQK